MGLLGKKKTNTKNLRDTIAHGFEIASGEAKTSFEDTESLLNLTLLLTAFMMSFTVSMTLGYSHEDLLAADAMHIQYQKAVQGIDADSDDLPRPAWVHIPSYFFAERGAGANMCFFTALGIGVGSYLALSYSDCRTNEVFFEKWIAIFRWPILGSFGFFIGGTMCFFNQITAAAEISFPRYDKYNDIFDNVNKEMVETYYNKNEAGAIQKMMQGYTITTIVLILVGILLPVIVTSVLQYYSKRVGQESEAAAASSASETEEESEEAIVDIAAAADKGPSAADFANQTALMEKLLKAQLRTNTLLEGLAMQAGKAEGSALCM